MQYNAIILQYVQQVPVNVQQVFDNATDKICLPPSGGLVESAAKMPFSLTKPIKNLIKLRIICVLVYKCVCLASDRSVLSLEHQKQSIAFSGLSVALR